MGDGVTVLGFEGPEKRLEIDFKRNVDNPLGLRAFSKDQWQEMLNDAKCTIISTKHNEHFDSFVLSESSLFVWPYKMMLKTCGTTTLLKVIPKLLEMAKSCQLSVELVMFSRKNFLFPQVQIYPHTDWSLEVNYLDQHFEGGQSYVLGPMSKDHWFLYLADYSSKDGAGKTKETTLELMMHNLEPSAAIEFYRKEGVEDQDKFPGVMELVPGQETDEFNSTPCGYSMNGLRDEVYSTIHVTPEPHCSYASFETNWVPRHIPATKEMLSRVFQLFKPGTVTLAYFAENVTTCHHGDHLQQQQPEPQAWDDMPGYKVMHRTVSQLGNNREITVCYLESDAFISKKSKRVRSNTNKMISPVSSLNVSSSSSSSSAAAAVDVPPRCAPLNAAEVHASLLPLVPTQDSNF